MPPANPSRRPDGAHASRSRRVLARGGLALAALLLVARTAGAAVGVLENPSPGSTRSGIGVVSGWVCSAGQVTLEIDGASAVRASYGTTRGDTAPVCGDANNGFGLLLNWNLLGDGPHQIRALADGVEIGSASFTVQTLGSIFLRDVSGRYLLPDFLPGADGDVIVEWQQAAQNFVLIQDPATRPAEIIAQLGSLEAQERMADQNLPLFIRSAAEPLNPEVVELIATGSSALPAILTAFNGKAGYVDDVPLSLLAYALEQIGDPAAVPALADWLEQNAFAELLWAPDFVTHAIKVLDGQGGLDTSDFSYGIEQQLDTIAQARVGAASSAATAAEAAPSAATAGGDSCVKTIVVTGIDAGGQERVVEVPYRVYSRDIQDQIAAETNPQKKSQLEAQRDAFLRNDRANYDSSDYKPLPGATVSVKSNCGGSVTERLLNAASARIGQPVVLGEGTTTADAVRDLARLFGTRVTGFSIDELTVIAHEYANGSSAHVEIPISTTATSALVYSKDVQGIPRTHTITTLGLGFDAVQNRYNFRPFDTLGQTAPRFYKLDPSRIRSIVVDSGACPCEAAAGGVPLTITQPSVSETSARVVQVAGTVGEPDVTTGTLRVNGSPQPIAVGNGAFASEAVLRSGDNVLRATVDAPDGRRGCAERSIRSTTAKTTLSATLTWNLPRTDVDLYVTQPDGQTAWFGGTTTSIGGRLDVDNTSGFGPENYFLSSVEGDTIVPGPYAVRVHYYRDQDGGDQQPTRPVGWRVVVLVNEGTDQERRQISQGTLSAESSTNDAPGSSGPDWANVTTVTFAADGSGSLVASAAGDAATSAATITGSLEIPQPNSAQSGIGVLSGWVCDASRVTLEVDGESTYEAAYGTTRADTQGVCGDADNGFGVLLNWNVLGDGGHRIRAFADGVQFGEARIVVKTLGVPFLRDVTGRYRLPGFAGDDVIIEWQQSQQNFAIVDVE